jgi:outer membrane lipoprotein-sorting protein
MIFRILSLVLIVSGLFVSASAQAPADEKSQQIMDRAVEALGGPNYLNVQTVTGKGFYTTFRDNVSQIPARFLDYIAYPDRERTEFVGAGIRTIQTNVGDTGWLFDGAVKKISDQTPTQVEDFKRAMRTTVENLLRGWWKKEGGKVKYVARREAGLAKRNEAIRLTYPDGFWIEYEFGARDGLPAKVIYKRTRKDPDSGDPVEVNEEDRILRFVTVNGVNAQWIIDHFVNDQQTSRINYESVQYNQPFSDTLFAKPDNVKSIK